MSTFLKMLTEGYVRKLPYKKRQEYDDLCDVIRELTEQYEQLQKEGKDTKEICKMLGIALEECFAFVQREFYSRNYNQD